MTRETATQDQRPIVFFWENLGPTHVDRIEAVIDRNPQRRVVAIAFRDRSDTYDWDIETPRFEVITLFRRGQEPGLLGRVVALWRAFWSVGRGSCFLCHYDWPEVFVVSWLLRLSGRRVCAMLDSKFDDKPRRAWREAMKQAFLMPYTAALVPEGRAADYVRFLGVKQNRVFTGYDTLSLARIRRQARHPSRSPIAFADRDFISIARLVPKKNHTMLLRAYAIYVKAAAKPRRLHLCGNGPLDGDIRRQVDALGLGDRVVLHGFLQSPEIAALLATSFCLLLPSREEQFGLAVIEAEALGVPVIVSDACGARDTLVRSGVNGFVIEPDNPEGMAFFMSLLDTDAALWRRLSAAARESADRGDAVHFAEAVDQILMR